MHRSPSPHALLNPPAQFSGSTVRRALLAWTRAGRRNPFPDVCRFYHYLEEKESTLPEDQKLSSQRQDYEQLSSSPPTPWQQTMFPTLYPSEPPTIPELTQRPGNSGATPDEIVAVSEMIKGYCLDHKTSLREFLSKFSEYASKYGVNPTVSNVAFFIQYQKVLEKERKYEEFKQKSFKPIDDRYIREETEFEDDGTSRYELFHEQTFSLHNVLKEIIQVDQIANKDTYESQCNIVDDDRDTDETITDLIDWSDPVDHIDFGIEKDLLNEVEEQDAVKFSIDNKELTYAKVTEKRPRTYSSLFDSKLNQPEETTYTGYENLTDSNNDQIDFINKKILPEINMNETLEIQQNISEDVIEINVSENIQLEIGPDNPVPIRSLTAISTKTEVQAETTQKPPKVTEKKNKKAKKNKKSKDTEGNKENMTINTRRLVDIPLKLKSSEISGNNLKSHQDKEIFNKVSTKIGMLKKKDDANELKETDLKEAHTNKNGNNKKSLLDENETFYSIREEKENENYSERSEYLSIDDSKSGELWTLDFTNFEAKAKVLKELFNRDLFEMESIESDTSILSGDFESLKTHRFSTSSE